MLRNKDKIAEVIENSFAGIYCDTCYYDMDSDACECCHRKYMNWIVSKEYARIIADRIIDVLDGVEDGEYGE